MLKDPDFTVHLFAWKISFLHNNIFLAAFVIFFSVHVRYFHLFLFAFACCFGKGHNTMSLRYVLYPPNIYMYSFAYHNEEDVPNEETWSSAGFTCS